MSNARPRRPLPQLPQWLEERLAKALSSSHFEASMYGPLNSFLTAYFPMEQQFLVKPQGLLRIPKPNPLIDTESESEYVDSEESYEPESEEGVSDSNDNSAVAVANEVEDGDQDDFVDANTSVDSYGAIVRSDKGLKGSGIPDFIVAKAGMQGNPDMALLIFEIKKRNVTLTYGRNRLCLYIYRAFLKTRSPNLAGLLIRGEDVEVYELDPKVVARLDEGDRSSWTPQRKFKTGDVKFKNYINRMATFHWENSD